MREILFRGKRTYNGEWVEGSLICYADGWTYICVQGENMDVLLFRVIPDTVGQYTGLTANGKKIFEGDILHPFDDEIIVVEWIDHYSTLGLTVYVSRKEKKRGKETIKEYSGWAYLNDYDLAKLEIIGNIHDNPELLKGAKDDA